MAQDKKNPARVCTLAGEMGRNRRIRDGGLSASNCDASTISKRGKRKTQRGSLPPGAGQVGGLCIVGNPKVSCSEVSTNSRNKEDPAIVNLLPEAKFQLAMGAATPLCHDAHLCSPAGRVDEKPSLRRKPEPNCGISEIKTPAKGQLVAEVFDCQNTRGASEAPELSLKATGTIAKNAWLVARVYRVRQNLMVDLQHG